MTTGELTNGTGASEIWIRLPRRGHEQHTGLSRGKLYQLIREGRIKSANLKDPGKLTGCRLIFLPSVLSYIAKHIEEIA